MSHEQMLSTIKLDPWYNFYHPMADGDFFSKTLEDGDYNLTKRLEIHKS